MPNGSDERGTLEEVLDGLDLRIAVVKEPDILPERPPIAATWWLRPLAGRRGLVALILAPLLLLVFVQPFEVLTDPDYWWHVRTGQYMYQTRSIPFADFYSYTAAGRPWVAHEWLTELLFYLVAAHVGYVGNVVLFGLLGALTALAVYAMCRQRGVGELASAVLMLWSTAMAAPALNVRPQVVTTFLVALLALLLTRYGNGHSRALWPLPLIFLLWVNLHGGYLIGLALLGLAVVGSAFPDGLRAPRPPPRSLLAVSALSGLATLLNPRGLEAWLYPFSYFGKGNASLKYVAEWQSANFHDPSTLVFASSLLLLVALGVARKPLGTVEVLWTIALTLLALQSMRNIALYAAVVLPLIGARLQHEWPAFRGSLVAWRRPFLLALICLALLVVVAATSISRLSKTTPQIGWLPNDAGYPRGAVDYLVAHDLRGNLFNVYGWGGYLIDRLYPERRVFIDGRIDVYGNSLGKQYDLVSNVGPGWQAVLDRYQVRIALVQTGTPLAAALAVDHHWRETYGDSVAELFVRSTS